MTWTRENPGAGDVGGIKREAVQRRNGAELLRTSTLAPLRLAISDAGSAMWVAEAATAFVLKAKSLLPDISLIITGLETDADALETYAVVVDGIKTDAGTLRYRQDALQQEIDRGVSILAGPDYAVGVSGYAARDLVQGIGEKQRELRRMAHGWDALEQRRRDADAACVAALTSTGSRGPLAALTGAGMTGVSNGDLMKRLGTLSSLDLTILLAQHPELGTQLAKSKDPNAVAAWWRGMGTPGDPLTPSATQLAMITGIPSVIGNLNGVNYTSRNLANKISLDNQIHASRDRISLLGKLPRDYINPQATPEVDAEKMKLNGLLSIRASLLPYDTVPRQLISLTNDDPPLAAVSVGDLDTAQNATYDVPGMNSSTSGKGMEGWAKAAQNLYTEEGFPGGPSRAVVAWIGYHTPPTPAASNLFDPGVLHGDAARAGAVIFAKDLAGLNAVRAGSPLSLNVVAHSYGTTTASLALAHADLHVDSFVNLGSAGIERSIPDAAAINADHVYAGQAQNMIPGLEDGKGDQWAWTGRYGSLRENPMDPSFGATTFNTDGVPGDPGGHGVTDHSTNMGGGPQGYGYLDRYTESLRNTALATTGRGDQTSHWVDPGLTDLQTVILTAAESAVIM